MIHIVLRCLSWLVRSFGAVVSSFGAGSRVDRFVRRALGSLFDNVFAIGWRKNRRNQNEGHPEASSTDCLDEDDFDSREYRVDTTDELYCGYDSTWEVEEPQESPAKTTRRLPGTTRYKFSRFESAARDMQNYRHDYRLMRQHCNQNDNKPNLSFYLGEGYSSPDDLRIDDFHDKWKGDYEKLEYAHNYIQWLFPLQEPGVNPKASTLTKEEIKEFLENSKARENLLKSYELMLDFYGIELCNKETGQVTRAPNWRDRFNNLDSHTHNNLRITRILKCLGTLGYPQYQYPLVLFFLKETLINGELPRVKESVLSYFVFAVLDKRQRRRLIKFAYLHYEPKDEFVWCPVKLQMMWSASKPQKRTNGENDTCEVDMSHL
uniref:opioid growth factor receptor-like n=1 Tax=Monopterus albus TaxID=43700 RepID=UPI0009B3B3B7|nr:opioid growth factor receptor-like [Monopterus albus]